MIEITDKVNCTGCSACEQTCPKQCITLVADAEGFKYPSVQKETCIECGRCEKVCPVLNVVSPTGKDAPKVYAAYSKDAELVKQSSSGAVFSEIAERVLKRGGAVCGVICDEQLVIRHHIITDRKDLDAMRGSKYVQSDLRDTFKQVLSLLKEGRQVLFTGAPCQVEGLLHYVPEKYKEHLVTMDFVCHGVPSPKVWGKYIHESCMKGKIQSIRFRSKIYGWRSFSLSISYDSFKYVGLLEKDPYLQTFMRDISLRPSCYDCKFKSSHRRSDLTVADFWKIWEVDPSMYQKMGVSMVIVNSSRGQDVLNRIKDNLVIKEEPVNGNPMINKNRISSAQIPSSRAGFFAEIDRLPFHQLYRKYVRKGAVYEMKMLAKCYLKLMMYYLK